jgi:flagellar motor switch protein FliG
MSMLVRYKKTGGFQQLLNLIETCTPAKREQLMKIIQAEDPSWAGLLKAKMLTIEKIFSWNPIQLAEITNEMPDRTLAVLLSGLGQEAFDKATHTMTHMKRGALERLMDELKPTPGEIEAGRIKLISMVREFERDRRIDLAQIDPSVSIRDLKVA